MRSKYRSLRHIAIFLSVMGIIGYVSLWLLATVAIAGIAVFLWILEGAE